MKLSDGEKIIILMLDDLYKKLGVSGEIDSEFLATAITSENIWGIPWKYSGIPFEERDNPPVVKEAVEVLSMWSQIEISYKQLSDEDKSRISEEAKPFGRDVKFSGFDGNGEYEYLNVADFLINELDRFQEFDGRDLNSHYPSMDGYRRMLGAYKPIREEWKSDYLSTDELITILMARAHPDYQAD